MNKIYEFIESIKENTNNGVYAETMLIFKKNLKRLEYILEYVSTPTMLKLNDLENKFPENFVDLATEETFLDRMFEKGETFENGKVTIIESIEDGEDEVKMTFVFDKFGYLTQWTISSQNMVLTLSNQEKLSDLVMFEFPSSNIGCVKLVKTLEGCISLNKAINRFEDFENILSFNPDKLDVKVTETSNMLKHWKQIAKRDDVTI